MLATITITPWHWVGFISCVMIFLAVDLGVFHQQAHVVRFKEALAWTTVWCTLAMFFALGLAPLRGRQESLEFLTGYIIELSLSMDNVFVIALIFTYFRVPSQYHHRVLFWGILGALLMRGVMIGVGSVLILKFHWMLYVFGAFLVFTGVRMFFADEVGVKPEKNPIIRLARKFFPVSSEFDGQKYLTRRHGHWVLTPLALVLVTVETTDLIFAVDSIPAIFAVTQNPFIVFTSNVFAILGLRSLYFVLAGAIDYFRFLKTGLSIVLVLVGAKMLVEMWDYHIPTAISLAVVASIILISILASVFVTRREAHGHPRKPGHR